MSNLAHGPKVRSLTPKESLATIECFKNNVLYGLRLNPDFRPYLAENFIFGKKTRTNPYRDLTDDITTATDDDNHEVITVIKSKEDKSVEVDWLLDQISNYAPNIPRNDIVKDSKSLNEVWQKIRLHYNKQQAGSLLNEVWNIKREIDETPQALFARIKQMYDDNLLTRDGLIHIEGTVTEDEELSPTLHNNIILHWLQVLHPELRELVTQRFITQLRDKTYATIFPEISRSVDSLLEELVSGSSACRVFTKKPYHNQSSQSRTSFQRKPNYDKPSYTPSYQKKRSCEFCRATGKRASHTHTIDECLYIKNLNLNNSAFAKQLECEEDLDEIQQHYEEFYGSTDDQAACFVEHIINRVNIDASPVLSLEKDHETFNATQDTGATCNVINEKTAKRMNAVIRPTTQRVRMADGKSSLEVLGETDVVLYRKKKPFHLSAIVCRNTDTDILAGMPFMKQNDVAVRPFSDEIIINGTEFVKYNPTRKPNGTLRRVTNFTVKSEKANVLLPGQSAEFTVLDLTGHVAVEPRWDSQCNRRIMKDSHMWPKPQVLPIINGHISLSNTSTEPIVIRRMEHICKLQPEITSQIEENLTCPTQTIADVNLPRIKKASDYSDRVSLNRDKQLSALEEESFKQILKTYDEVFNPVITRYNGKSGPCYVRVNMGTNLPPQRKGRLPFYGRNDLVELQSKFDELLANGVLSRPEEIGVIVENINPSFLVKKQPPSTDKRLVTDFSSIADFCRPTPSLMPDVDTILRSIASWKYLIKTDMSSAYHQIPMKKTSKKFCGVHTPYKGLMVYNVGCMGLPGVEVALEELTCLVLGDMVMEGKVSKIADDLFIGGNTPEELLSNFHLVLQKFLTNNIKLSAIKTIISPKEVTILGWSWSAGQLKASSHRLLALATSKKPENVTAMRSFLGAYRFLARVLKGYAKLLSPLESAIKSKNSKDKIVWTEQLSEAFAKAQEALSDAKIITIPCPTDTLCIVTDASICPGALGATLYAVRNGESKLAGFYNSKLPEYQTRWTPCEYEGLGIAASLNHFAPYIIQSTTKPQVYTDSKPCVQAVQKLKRGEFSASSRLSTFLSGVSRYQAQVSHISGSMNIPSDYASRQPLDCKSESCSVCKFIAETIDSVVQTITVDDVIEGRSRIPFTNRNTWIKVQEECRDLRKVKDFRKQGTTPNKKSKNLRSVRRYLSAEVLLAHDGLLIQHYTPPLSSVVERIVVPQQVLHGILTVLHLRLNHPTAHQLGKAFSRYFFALNIDKSIAEVTKGCHPCASIKDVPTAMLEQSTEDPPTSIGGRFAADIIKRCSQKICIIRETVTSYTLAELIPDETVKSVTECLIKQCNLLRPSPTTKITVRLDPAPAHQSMYKNLCNNSLLTKSNINLEIGRELNKNKNPVIDKGIREIHRELLLLTPMGGPITAAQLSQAIANLNTRYRRSGLSAHELWTQRDQNTGDQLPIKDREIIISQHKARKENHEHSQKSKAHGRPFRSSPEIKVGALVYIYQDRDKVTARQRYLVTNIKAKHVILRRFSTHLFGTKEYEAKLQDCYIVPSMEDARLPAREESRQLESGESSTDEDVISSPMKVQHNLRQPDMCASNSPTEDPTDTSVSEPEDLEEEIESESDITSDDETVLPGRQGTYTDDPDEVPPKNLVPATMERDKRTRKKPDKYGAWTS